MLPVPVTVSSPLSWIAIGGKVRQGKARGFESVNKDLRCGDYGGYYGVDAFTLGRECEVQVV